MKKRKRAKHAAGGLPAPIPSPPAPPGDPIAEAELAAAVRELYRAFGHYKGEKVWDDPLDNHSEEFCSQPARLSVKQLNLEDVDYFYHHATCLFHGSSLHAYHRLRATRYFLPRLFEAAVAVRDPRAYEPRGSSFDWWFIAEQLVACDWRQWRPAEREAVEHFLTAWWRTAVACPLPAIPPPCDDWPPIGRRPAEALEAAAMMGADVTPWLAAWRADRTPAGLLHLAVIAVDAGSELVATGYLWPSAPAVTRDAQQSIALWLVDEQTARQLAAVPAGIDDVRRRKVGEALRALGEVRLTWRSLTVRDGWPEWVRGFR